LHPIEGKKPEGGEEWGNLSSKMGEGLEPKIGG